MHYISIFQRSAVAQYAKNFKGSMFMLIHGTGDGECIFGIVIKVKGQERLTSSLLNKHYSIISSFITKTPVSNLGNSLFQASGYFSQRIISLVIEAVKHSPF